MTVFFLILEPNGIPFGSKSKGKVSPRLYPIQYERKWNASASRQHAMPSEWNNFALTIFLFSGPKQIPFRSRTKGNLSSQCFSILFEKNVVLAFGVNVAERSRITKFHFRDFRRK